MKETTGNTRMLKEDLFKHSQVTFEAKNDHYTMSVNAIDFIKVPQWI